MTKLKKPKKSKQENRSHNENKRIFEGNNSCEDNQETENECTQYNKSFKEENKKEYKIKQSISNNDLKRTAKSFSN